MPKFIEKYIILRTKPIIINNIEHYEAKQKDSNNDFILKRVNIQNDNTTSTKSLHSIPQSLSKAFQQLTNETLILKLLDNVSIPKCLRMLKTSNSVYFVYNHYSLISLKQYLQKNDPSFQTKIQISINILTAVNYIHKKAVVYRGINEQNIKIGNQSNVYFTNFSQSKNYQNIDQKLKSLNQVRKQCQFKSFINEDLLDFTKLLLRIFNLNEINPQQYEFQHQIQKKLYYALSQKQQKKFNFIKSQNLLQILTFKETLKTNPCTSASQSILSVNIKYPRKSEKIKNNVQIPPLPKNFSKSFSSTNFYMRTSTNKENSLKRLENTSQISIQYTKQNLASNSNLLKSQRLSLSDQLNSVVGKFEKQKQKEIQTIKNNISAILSTRKIINLILHCMKSIKTRSGVFLTYLLALKCQFLSLKEQKQVQRCLLQMINTDQKQVLKQIKKEGIKTIINLQIIKQSLKQLMSKEPCKEQSKKYDLLQGLVNQKRIQEKLSNQIYFYLRKETSQMMQNNQNLIFKSRQKNQNANLKDIETGLYEKLRNLYYLSIRLKYSSFEEFFEKKNNFETDQLAILKDQYFKCFQASKIPFSKVFNQVIYRMEIFLKNQNKDFLISRNTF